jgi:Ankyrin repeats (3 copies)
MMEQQESIEIDLDALIEDQRWDEAYERFLAAPDETRKIVNPSLGWTKLHWLCNVGSAPQSLIELVASLYPEAIALPDNRYGDTPLHMLCRNSVTSADNVKILLSHLSDVSEGILIRNRFGGTALHSASNHNAVLEVLQELITANPRILRVRTREGIHAVGALWHSYLQTIPGYMIIARILEGETVEEAHFDRFWKKVEYLSTEAFLQRETCPPHVNDRIDFVLHGLIQCNLEINAYKVAIKINPSSARASDVNGNLPLHLLVENRPFRLKEKDGIVATLVAYPDAAQIPNHAGDLPLMIAIRNKIPWENGMDEILNAATNVVRRRDGVTGLYPFQLAAAVGGRAAVDTTYHLLLTQPDLLAL